jgi:hypothetical protein
MSKGWIGNESAISSVSGSGILFPSEKSFKISGTFVVRFGQRGIEGWKKASKTEMAMT